MKDWKIRLILFGSICYLHACAYVNRRFYTEPSEYFQKALKNAPYDALIVPGFPHIKDSMTTVVQNRVYWAWYLYNKGIVKNVIFSGNSVYTPYKEAEIMAMYAVQIGIPAEHIFTDIQAEHSTENLYFSYKIAQEHRFERVAVGTESSQSSFMYSINNHRFKIPVDFIPIVYDTLKTIEMAKPAIDQDSALTADFVSIIDREGLFKRLRGTRGRRVEQLMREDGREQKNNGEFLP
ncbi:MAG: YdcF family protein [Cytophaga sp.]|uniref:YdcF family protein n=1 Tax=Cytophaga sp. TaxID=29535 RepID=UPI003F809BA1